MEPLTTPEKIKLLREQNGLTYEAIANYVGVGKSTVRKWETGFIQNMRRDKIAKLSEILHTTPAYLMGWSEEEKCEAAAPKGDGLSETKRLLIDLIMELDDADLDVILAAARAIKVKHDPSVQTSPDDSMNR